MDTIVLAEAPVPELRVSLDPHLNDPNWPDSDTQTPATTDISLETQSYTTRSIDKIDIDAASITAPSSKDYDFDQCGPLHLCSNGPLRPAL